MASSRPAMTAARSQRRRAGESSCAAALICRNVHGACDMSRLPFHGRGISLRHAVLGMLSVPSCTGYELTQWFDSSLQHAWHARHSQIYPELGKLEAEGLAEVVEEGARRSKTYAVTEA